MIYFLLGYAVIGVVVAVIIAAYDYRHKKLNPASALLGGLFWPVAGLLVLLFSKTNLDALYARKARRLEEKQTQQRYRQQRRKGSKK